MKLYKAIVHHDNKNMQKSDAIIAVLDSNIEKKDFREWGSDDSDAFFNKYNTYKGYTDDDILYYFDKEQFDLGKNGILKGFNMKFSNIEELTGLQAQKGNFDLGTFTIDVQLNRTDGTYDVYVAHNEDKGKHYGNIDTAKIGQVITNEIGLLAQSYHDLNNYVENSVPVDGLKSDGNEIEDEMDIEKD